MHRLYGFIAALVLMSATIPALGQETMYRRFIDVRTDDFFAQDLDRLVDEGILKGYDDGRFGPNDAVTRGQIAAILRRYDANNVQPLREQIRLIREELNMGACGDGTIQDGEECDDGNVMNGDGCSAYCMERDDTALCSGGHRIGESYIGADGCNRCSCTERGEMCTKMACPKPEPEECDPYLCADGTRVARCSDDGHVINYFAPPCMTHGGEVGQKCLSDESCPQGTVCSTRYGDCESACEPGAEACIMACAGRCVEPRDGEETSCEELRQNFDDLAASETACRDDGDCVIVEASCPYVTCGVAVSATAARSVKSAADRYIACIEESGEPVSCAGCMAMTARCMNNRCVTVMR